MTPGEGLELPRSSGEGPAAGVGVRQVLRGRKAHTPRWGRHLVLRKCAPEQSGTGDWGGGGGQGRGGIPHGRGAQRTGLDTGCFGVCQEWRAGWEISTEVCKDLTSDAGFQKPDWKISATSGSVGQGSLRGNCPPEREPPGRKAPLSGLCPKPAELRAGSLASSEK